MGNLSGGYGLRPIDGEWYVWELEAPANRAVVGVYPTLEEALAAILTEVNR